MDVLESIVRRKSVHLFEERELDTELQDELFDYISGIELPEPEIDWNFDFLPYEDMKHFLGSEPNPKAPHYLVLRSQRVNFCLQSMGFLGSLTCIWLAGKGIGSCFMGGLSPQNEFEDVLPYTITIAVGYSAEGFHSRDEIRGRKKFDSVVFGYSQGKIGEILKYAILSPSSLNRQPISYLSTDGRISVFRKKVALKWPPTSFVQCIDAGVAMGTIIAAAEALGCRAKIVRLQPEPIWGSRIYQATVTIETAEEQSIENS